MTQANEYTKCWIDDLDNTYAVERASNGKFIVARHNQGGHRKVLGDIQPSRSITFQHKALNSYAENKGWKERLSC